MKMIHNISILQRILLAAGVGALGLLLFIPIALYDLHETIDQERRRTISILTENAYNVAETWRKRAAQGELSELQAQDQALKQIASMRYEGDNYIWINDMSGVILMHPVRSDLIGRDVKGVTDARGAYVFQDIIDLVNQRGEGFYRYVWNRSKEGDPGPKISHIRGHRPWGWVIATGVWLDDRDAAFNREALRLGGVGALALILAAAAAAMISRSLSTPMGQLADAMRRMAAGDVAAPPPTVPGRSEIADMARALAVFRTSILDAERLNREAVAKRDADIAAARKRDDATRAFESGVQALLRQVGATVDQARGVARSLRDASATTAARSADAAAAAEQAAANGHAVAAAAEQLGGSVQEISRQISHTSTTAAHAVTNVEQTDVAMRSLSEAAREIGDIVDLINAIAGQTNLLALNATIEAARAGDAGRGFAVVASEVKTLASQTASATGDISAQVSEIQSTTQAMAQAIAVVGETVRKVGITVSAIAAAVEQQNAATAEIARNAQAAADDNHIVSRNVASAAAIAGDAGGMAADMATVADALASEAKTLHDEVEAFLLKINAC